MNVEKRENKGIVKYYLTHSFREEGKSKKVRKYLGQNLSEARLTERKIIAEKLILEDIHKNNVLLAPLRLELTKEQIENITKLEKSIPLKISHFSKEKWRSFSESFTYNTNAIEGSHVNKKEVKNILEHDKWPDKSKEDIAETYGVNEAIQYIRTTKDEFSINLIKQIHKIVFKNSKSFAGKFRKTGQEVFISDGSGKIVHEGAPPNKVVSLLNELIKWYQKNEAKYPGLILAAIIHNQFENIHPFADGNGRVGRILLNYVLLKQNLPPLDITMKHRLQYYSSLQSFSQIGEIQPTIDLFVQLYKSQK